MKDNKIITQLISESEWLMEGLDKGFWRLVKLLEPEVWTSPQSHKSEHTWVVGLFGNYCLAYDDEANSFRIARYKKHGEITEYLRYQAELPHLIQEIVSSRFVIN